MNNDKSILIIDDEVQIRKLLTITLECTIIKSSLLQMQKKD